MSHVCASEVLAGIHEVKNLFLFYPEWTHVSLHLSSIYPIEPAETGHLQNGFQLPDGESASGKTPFCLHICSEHFLECLFHMF